MNQLSDLIGLKRGKATFRDYEKVVHDHPAKFRPSQVDFKHSADTRYPCRTCIHFYRGKSRNVCEILRLPDSQSILPTDGCDFHSTDGVSYPLYHPPEKE